MSTDSGHDALDYLNTLRGGRLGFGEMIESIRKADGVAQAELARRIGVSRAHLCDIEKGRRHVTPERAAQLADALGYPVNLFVAKSIEDSLARAGLNLRVEIKAA